LAKTEARQLVAVAKRDEISVSEVVRDALYEIHGIGELEAGE
jgi:hypothetical protein